MNKNSPVAIFGTPNPWDVGIVEMDEEERILSFVEKPPRGCEIRNLGSGGVYVLSKGIFNYIPGDGTRDFAYDILPQLLELYLPIYGYVLKAEDYLLDIGTLENCQKVNEDIKAVKVKTRYGK